MNAYRQYIAFITIVRKELRRSFRIWAQTILPPIITTILYFIIFGRIIGTRIGTMEGFNYVQYIAPGLIMLTIINNAYSASVFAFFSSKFQRNIEELLVAPVSNWIILVGYMSGGVLRSIIVGFLVAVIATFFTHLPLFSFVNVLLVALLSSAIFSLGGIINAIFASRFDEIAIIPTFILTPLTYLGGVFYSIKLLPPVWKFISNANPILYIVNTFRYGFLGIPKEYVLGAFSIMIFCALVLFILALTLLKKGVGLRY